MAALENQGVPVYSPSTAAADFAARVRQNDLERQLRLHRHDAALDAALKQVVAEGLTLLRGGERPAAGLLVDVRNRSASESKRIKPCSANCTSRPFTSTRVAGSTRRVRVTVCAAGPCACPSAIAELAVARSATQHATVSPAEFLIDVVDLPKSRTLVKSRSIMTVFLEARPATAVLCFFCDSRLDLA